MREKMPLSLRAKQFLPFDAVKGFRQALKAKEYEVEAVSRGKLSEDEAKTISTLLAGLQGNEEVEAKYYKGGHYLFAYGLAKLVYEENYLIVGNQKISLNDLFGLRVLSSNK